MKPDMCVPCGEGLINIRVGAIIVKNGRLLMAGNHRTDYLYSVGGRIKFGETAEEAIVREVFEETGVRMKAERLACVHENYFYGDIPSNLGKLIYEISFYYYMDVPEDFEPSDLIFNEDGNAEFLQWVEPDTEKTIYPCFFREILDMHSQEVRHFVTDER